MKCKICGIRKPRRYCPGVAGDICSLCCGAEREVTVDCPLDCGYLQEAHLHEKPTPVDASQLPHSDVRVTEEFLESHQELILFCALTIYAEALRLRNCADLDVRDALESLTQTFRLLQSGLYYDRKLANPLAAALHEIFEERVAELRNSLKEKMMTLQDAEILGVLVFLQRLERRWNNGRPRSRAFLDSLRRLLGSTHAQDQAESRGPLIIA